MSINIFNLVIYFTAYSFLGWLCETIYCSLPKKQFVNRGFLNGPFCPIYGFGALIIIICLTRFRYYVFLLFIFSVILTSTLEYLTSYVMEKIFHAKWWDYSENKFNINGRVCLKNSLLFGLMSVFFMEFIHRGFSDFIHSIPTNIVETLAIIFIVYFVLDMTASIITAMKINIMLSEIKISPNVIKEKFEKYNPSRMLKIRFQSRRIFYNRIISAFPNLKYKNHHESLDVLKELLKKKKL